ncbi:FAD-dependent monooxygenase [Stackebrandtia nassauensis]|uniref:Monooxygenase FAD-binding protein n=1 Tax=Stackebrandtia nassauensis (strain DSM 44728 / CIP 108903 / NRRL B-16338 / NBRC 102104 / LLR-40K-21) TaxID=446470 RepID=D3PYW4_STANL|nr:FAD-dependent monooxygenase [Stackebrandtia nassauensis]ADD43547.1 monooxygenase FAD-binding protein [Stackebrandtia nassauensis DSM 44728]
MKAVICGAGIAGLALAQRLASIDWEVVVVEKAPGPREQGYMIDFFGPGLRAATAMGIEPRLRELGYKVREFSYLDETGRKRASLDYQRFSRVADGLLSIMRPDLERTLREALPATVDLRFATTITAIHNRPDGVTVTLSDGQTLEADLLVGADGIHSRTRAMVFGPEERYLRHLGLHTAAFTFTDPEIHAEVRDGFYLTDTVAKEMGMYGMRDGKVSVFTVHRTDSRKLPDDPRAVIRETYADLGWRVPRALELCPPPSHVYYDLVAQIHMPNWVDKRVVLVGDACYAVSLLAGQGASLGIAGAHILAGQLRTGTVDEALARYQRLWHPIATERQRIGRNGAKWIVPTTPTQLWLRRLAIKAMGIPGLDRYLGSALVGKDHTDVDALAVAEEPAAA